MPEPLWFAIYRRLHPRSYIRLQRAATLRNLHRAHKITPNEARQEAVYRLQSDLDELREWQAAIDDERLFHHAKKVGVYIDEIDFNLIQKITG